MNKFSPKEYIRLLEISGILRIHIRDLEVIFYNTQDKTEPDIILSYLNNKYDLSLGDDDILNYIIHIIGINKKLLYYICADYDDFYQGLTTFQACEIILNKILHNKKFTNKFN